MRTERDLRNQIAYAYEKGYEEGLKIGEEEGLKIGKEEGRKLIRTKLRVLLREKGYSEDRIRDIMEKCCSDSN